ncbi:hypothetical protein FPV67DRAFT_1454838 [Lyophyllum atratum]|nr:hypothetical protein FPV67DRAFT_1454838 [Lyophyllum atratum]
MTCRENLKKPELVKLVLRQSERWPDARFWGGSQVRKERIMEVLLDPVYKFSKAAISTSPSGGDASLAQADEPGPVFEPITSSTALAHDTDNQDGSTVTATLGDASGGSTAAVPTEIRKVRLLITDYRPSGKEPGSPSKSVETVSLTQLASEDVSAGFWLASAQELVVQLQRTCSVVHGAVKLAVPDPIDSTYLQPFARTSGDDERLEDAEFHPSTINIPDSSVLQLVIEPVERAKHEATRKRRLSLTSEVGSDIEAYTIEPKRHQSLSKRVQDADSEVYDVNSPDFIPLEQGRKKSRILKRQRLERKEQEIEWLKSKAAEHPGYSDFTSNRGRVQQNVGVIRSWRFITSFMDTYHHKKSDITGNKKMTKTTIENSLDIKSTTFAEAQKGMELAKRFGENGSCEAPEVVDVLAESDSESPGGARGLLRYLKEWEKDHK